MRPEWRRSKDGAASMPATRPATRLLEGDPVAKSFTCNLSLCPHERETAIL
jgi:hypothetical protein